MIVAEFVDKLPRAKRGSVRLYQYPGAKFFLDRSDGLDRTEEQNEDQAITQHDELSLYTV